MMKFVVLTLAVTLVVADVAFLPGVQRGGPVFRILRQEQDIDPSGNYNYIYETENGISAQERGTAGGDAGTAAQGSFSYTSPEGIPVHISYVADENGFQPQGDVLPTPPPIPAAILRSLEYIRTHPQQDQAQKRFF